MGGTTIAAVTVCSCKETERRIPTRPGICCNRQNSDRNHENDSDRDCNAAGRAEGGREDPEVKGLELLKPVFGLAIPMYC